MCGIVGYIGSRNAVDILLDGLSRLEYRGYDSAGMAVRDDDAPVNIVKSSGRLHALQEKIKAVQPLEGKCGIGHTRWATHGGPSEENAHPHMSDDLNVVLVHNGIIENYLELREKLTHAGYAFYGNTDTEVAAKLIDYYYKKYRGSAKEALARSMMRIRGSYALAVMFRDEAGHIFAARRDSPLVIGAAENEMYLASDVQALIGHTRCVYYIENMEIADLTVDGVQFCTVDQEVIHKKAVEINWSAKAGHKNGFEHYMMKEIHEQPRAVGDTVRTMQGEYSTEAPGFSLDDDAMCSVRRIYIVACGSAWHAGMAVRCAMEELARIPVEVEIASEFRYRRPILEAGSLVIIISQSGETADSLAALREARKLGVDTLAIVNVAGSAIAREADYVIYTQAGPEIAVATTKAYSAQLAAGYLLALRFALVQGRISNEKYGRMLAELKSIPDKIRQILENKARIQWFASKFSGVQNAFFMGRGVDYAAAMEGSLKFKEISYAHTEAYAAGELKHGTISLIEENTLVVCLLTQPQLYEKMMSNMVECKSRGAYLVCVAVEGNRDVENVADFTVYIPQTEPCFAALLAVVPMQLMAYYVSVARGLDVDKPRNLAKSVTVE